MIEFVDLNRLKTGKGRRRPLASGLAVGILGGILGGLLSGFAYGLLYGLVLGLQFALMLGIQIDLDDYSASDPLQIIRTTVASGLALGLASGLVLGLEYGLVYGLVYGVAVGLPFEITGIRYIALLLCTRYWSDHWLPWRLGRFLHWCYEAGLIRVAGISYQFRHRELQDYLVRNPDPPHTLPGPAAGWSR